MWKTAFKKFTWSTLEYFVSYFITLIYELSKIHCSILLKRLMYRYFLKPVASISLERIPVLKYIFLWKFWRQYNFETNFLLNLQRGSTASRIFGRGDFFRAILKYQKPMMAWSKTGNHIGGSLPSFMRKSGKRDFLSALDFFWNIRSQW